ncbi:rCG24325 [Rattus norvegicus]|uniref:RCG24325 n=1 Tax=Rattus norvegicus TaxID=10116 RepID=A6K586_RAT|nr:rCG24325 [Rattus norvegicus]
MCQMGRFDFPGIIPETVLGQG